MQKPDEGGTPPAAKPPETTPPADGNDGGTPPETPPADDGKGDLNKAVREARYEARKAKEGKEAADKELSEFRQKEKDREEATLKRKGEYETLSNNLKTESEALKAENKELKTFKEQWETDATDRISKMKEGLPEDSLELLNATLEGKTLQQQETLLPKLVDRFKLPSNINTPPTGGTPQTSENAKKLSDLEEKKKDAKEKKDFRSVLKYDSEIQKIKQAK